MKNNNKIKFNLDVKLNMLNIKPFENRDIISMHDFSKEEIIYVMEIAKKFEDFNMKILNHKIIATLFFEPSTRTRLSFESAMIRLGGKVIGFSDSNSSSIAKGESLEDTIKVVEHYCDGIIIRHPENGSAEKATNITKIPIINAGDGTNQHPTQTFLDLYTIKKTKKHLTNLNIGFIGDLKNGRTVHSLAEALAHFNCNFFFVSPKSLKMPDEILKSLKSNKINFVEKENVLDVIKDLDIMYVTRMQRERFSNIKEYDKVKDYYIINKQILSHAKKNIRIMHPLPRINEIHKDVDGTEQALYFEQAYNGFVVRKALLSLVLGKVE